MKLDLFDYFLPLELIAQKPISPRDCSRLFVYEREENEVIHRHFYDLPDLLIPGDVLVLNNTKVFPARLIGQKDTGGKVEIFLLREIDSNIWEVLIGGKRMQEGVNITISKKLNCKIKKRNSDSTWLVEFNLQEKNFWHEINKVGQVPTPPYIKRESDMKEYQTVFARIKGSVAAPTAGLHFTKKLLNKLRSNGVQIEYITLHVGLGTFAPVKESEIEDHHMHAEWASLDKATAEKLNEAKIEKRRIIAVGTTSARTLESFANYFSPDKGDKRGLQKLDNPPKSPYQGGILAPQTKWIDTFIYPGYNFKFIDGLLTNFHLPKSTLLMLLSTFLAQNKKPEEGIEILHQLYTEAIKEQYRFYSYGDGMLII